MPQDVERDGRRRHPVDPAAVVYEITLRRTPPAGLTARFPSMTLHSMPAVTVLFRQVADPTEIDGLIERLRSIGITPLEMHASSSYYEFWIQGHLGESTLRSMRWAARFEQEHVREHWHNFLDVMRHQHKRGRVFAAPETLEKLQEVFARCGVESCAGFVKDQKLRLRHQRTTNEHALTLSLRKHTPRTVGEICAFDLS